MYRLFYIILIGYETQNGFGKGMATLLNQVLTKQARCCVNLVIWLIITAILASKQTMIMLESRMPGQLACPVWRGLGRNASQQWDDRAPLPPYGRPFGRLVNISLDMIHHQGWISSPWRLWEPSSPKLVSFQGTSASREGEIDRQDANVQERMGWG